ncbi:MAG: hypothetical protein C4321_06010, partial [Chloroflexota bacterium]
MFGNREAAPTLTLPTTHVWPDRGGAADLLGEIELPSDLDCGVAFREFVRRTSASHLPQEAVDDLVLAAGEAFNNAVHHGRPEPEARIRARVLRTEPGVEVVLTYPGDP